MKKIMMFVAAVMLSVAAFAQVRVSQGGIVTTYEKGATINIDSKDVTEVMYGNVSISIPKGKKVVISQNKAGNIVISGYDLVGVKIMGREVKADDASVYVVNPTTKTIVKAPVAQTTANNQKNNQQNNNKQNNTQNNNANNQENAVEDNFQDVNDYVNEVASQQAKEDLEEELSPSSPR